MNTIRKNIITSIYEAGCGHPGGSLSATEIFTYLNFTEMNIHLQKPEEEEKG